MPGSSVGEPAPTSARQGRHRQRYGANGERLVAGCIPVRLNGKADSADCVDVCLISSRAGKGYCFPKGGWEDDETVEAAAMRETVEEAGVRGTLEEPMVGQFPFCSTKTGHAAESTPHGGRCLAHMYIMKVEEELDVWPESEERQRIWCSLAEASSKCKNEWMRDALHMWVRRKGWASVLDSCTSNASTSTSKPADGTGGGADGAPKPLLLPTGGYSTTSLTSNYSDSVDTPNSAAAAAAAQNGKDGSS